MGGTEEVEEELWQWQHQSTGLGVVGLGFGVRNQFTFNPLFP